MRLLLFIVLCFAGGWNGIPKATAQQAVGAPASGPPAPAVAASASLVAHSPVVTSSRPASPTPLAVATARETKQTKVLRIYGGAGYFDVAIAEKLRPILAKGFVLSKSNGVKAAAGEISAPTKADSQMKVPVVSNL